MVSHKLLGMATIVSVLPLSLAFGGIEVTDVASGERSVRPMEDVEAELRDAAQERTDATRSQHPGRVRRLHGRGPAAAGRCA
jgi:hypothetical protein